MPQSYEMQKSRTIGGSFFSGQSPVMMALDAALAGVANASVPVLFIGENGVGKTACARRLHQLSDRRAEPFLEVNCTNHEIFRDNSVFSSFLESGSVFLDEISFLCPASQLKILQFLLDHREPSNGTAGPRIMAGSRKGLETEIRNGKFREDLHYRLSSVCLLIPPLRHRKEDVAALADFFLEKYCALLDRDKPVLSPRSRRALSEYVWPGNVRELENLIKAVVAFGEDQISLNPQLGSILDRRHSESSVSLKQAARAASRNAERQLILQVLTKVRWNRKRAAEELQISYKALLYKLKQIGVDDVEGSVSPREMNYD